MEKCLLCTSGPVVKTDVFFEANDGLVFVVSSEMGKEETTVLTRSRSKSLSQGVVRGKFGSTKYAIHAITTVADPSMMNNHLAGAY